MTPSLTIHWEILKTGVSLTEGNREGGEQAQQPLKDVKTRVCL